MYSGALFWDEDDDDFDFDNPTSCIRVVNEKVTHLYFDGGILADYEILQICKVFPNLTDLKIEGENILEYQFDLTSLKNITNLALELDPSNEFSGYIDEEETDPKLKFSISLEPS